MASSTFPLSVLLVTSLGRSKEFGIKRWWLRKALTAFIMRQIASEGIRTERFDEISREVGGDLLSGELSIELKIAESISQTDTWSEAGQDASNRMIIKDAAPDVVFVLRKSSEASLDLHESDVALATKLAIDFSSAEVALPPIFAGRVAESGSRFECPPARFPLQGLLAFGLLNGGAIDEDLLTKAARLMRIPDLGEHEDVVHYLATSAPIDPTTQLFEACALP